MEQHLWFNKSEEIVNRYGETRVSFEEQLILPRGRWEPEILLRQTLLFGGLRDGARRVNLEALVRLRPQVLDQWALFTRFVWGQDYYNIRFDQNVTVFQVGLAADFVSIARFGSN